MIASAILLFLLTQAAAVGAVVMLPADYFVRPDAGGRRWLRRAVGAVLVLIGVILSLPGVIGPGVLVIGAGLVLVKRAWLRRLAGLRGALGAANSLRARFGRPPLQF